MSVVACEGCKAEISAVAAVCPMCGRPTEHNVRGCLLQLALVAAGCALLGLGLYEYRHFFH